MAPVRPLLVVALLALLAGCVKEPYDRKPDEVSKLEWTLEPGSFYLPTLDVRAKTHVRVHVNVIEGEPIDAFLSHGHDCRNYPTSDLRPVATLLGARNGTLEGDLPAGGGCVILDNHDLPPGTSPGLGTVRVSYRIEMWNA